MKLLVTGAAGFVGLEFSKVARDAGHEVTGLVRRPVRGLTTIGADALICDIRDVQPTDLGGYDAVVHFAAATSGDADAFLNVTVGGTAACLSAAIDAEVPRFVHISSASVYPGRLPALITDTLDVPLDPYPQNRGIYPQSKIGADRLISQTWHQSHPAKTEITIVRPGMVFGSNMASPLAGTAVEAPGGLVLGLGRPDQRVPYIHVQDLARGILGLLNAPVRPGELSAFDAFTPNAPTKAELIRMHGYLTGRARRAIWVPGFAMVNTARLAGLALARARPDNALGYKVARYYDLELDRLPVSRFWDAAASTAGVRLTEAVCQALTLDQELPPSLSRVDPKDVAHEHLAAAAPHSVSPEHGEHQEIVIVGAGHVVDELHVPAIRALGLRVTAVVDRDRRAATRLAARLGATAYDSLAAVFLPIGSDGTAVIATPGPTHANLAREAMGLGWNVMLEKPAATSRADYEAAVSAAIEHGRRVTVIHNYRFRPATMALWRLLHFSDVGALVGATVDFQMGRISSERAAWSRGDFAAKPAILELAIHFVDIACSVAGAVAIAEPVLVDRRRGGDIARITASGRSTAGAQVTFNLGYTETAQRTRILLEFERSTIEVGFFPDGCRVLPRRSTPIDDAMYSAIRFARFVSAKLPPHRFPVAPNAAGHLRLYRHHLRRTTNTPSSSVCDLSSIAPTMDTIYALSTAVYDELE